MANLLKVALPGYMTATPRRLWWVGDLFGNNNYQQGGDTLRATDLGMTGLEWVDIIAGGMSVSQNYFVQVFMPANSANVNEAQASAANNVTLKWFYSANSNQVANNANLSLEAVRLLAIGV